LAAILPRDPAQRTGSVTVGTATRRLGDRGAGFRSGRAGGGRHRTTGPRRARRPSTTTTCAGGGCPRTVSSTRTCHRTCGPDQRAPAERRDRRLADSGPPAKRERARERQCRCQVSGSSGGANTTSTCKSSVTSVKLWSTPRSTDTTDPVRTSKLSDSTRRVAAPRNTT
jgi:hypothetical protein